MTWESTIRFCNSVQSIHTFLQLYCIQSWHYLCNPASKAANMNPKMSLQNGAGGKLKLRNLKPRKITLYKALWMGAQK